MRKWIWLVMGGLFLCGLCWGQNSYYIDNSISSASCSTYSVTARSCAGGTTIAYQTLEGFRAGIKPAPGDTVYIRGGTYNQQLIILVSGSAGNPITYRNYGTETVTLSGSPTNAWYDDGSSPWALADVHSDGQTLVLVNVSHVVVQGLSIGPSRGNGHCHNCTHVIIQNNTF